MPIKQLIIRKPITASEIQRRFDALMKPYIDELVKAQTDLMLYGVSGSIYVEHNPFTGLAVRYEELT
jgi:hypothetical protein